MTRMAVFLFITMLILNACGDDDMDAYQRGYEDGFHDGWADTCDRIGRANPAMEARLSQAYGIC